MHRLNNNNNHNNHFHPINAHHRPRAATDSTMATTSSRPSLYGSECLERAELEGENGNGKENDKARESPCPISIYEDQLKKMESELLDWQQKVNEYLVEFERYQNDSKANNLAGGSDTEDEEEDWVVERILQRRQQKRAVKYLVKWKGHDPPRWEWEEDLISMGWTGKIEEFYSRRNSKPVCRGRAIPKSLPAVDSVPSLSSEEFEALREEEERVWNEPY